MLVVHFSEVEVYKRIFRHAVFSHADHAHALRLQPVWPIAQRIVRAKRTLSAARVPFETPPADQLPERLSSVLEVIYLIFNEGYAATSGADWMRPALCSEALRLGHLLADLMPHASEAHGLVALMEMQASRTAARITPDGDPVLLQDQDRNRWDRMQIRRGLTALGRAEEKDATPGPYALQAAIAACHARASTVAETDWAHIVALYDALSGIAPSPVVELNRAVAVSRAFGPASALECIDALRDSPALEGYHLLPAVRGDLLEQLGRSGEARAEFEHAAALARNEREQVLLRKRAAACRP
jgi:predicted RNA polymerase sigma factor